MRFAFTEQGDWRWIVFQRDDAVRKFFSDLIDKNFRNNRHILDKNGVPQSLLAIFFMPDLLVEQVSETFDYLMNKYGIVYINKSGGMCGKATILHVVEASEFPKEPIQPKQWPGGTHWYIGDKKFATKQECFEWQKSKGIK